MNFWEFLDRNIYEIIFGTVIVIGIIMWGVANY